MTSPKKTPYYLVDESKVQTNLKLMRWVKEQTGCHILLATKAFSCYHIYPLIAEYLDGTTNSSLNETRLSFEHFGKQTHVYAPAFSETDMPEIAAMANCVTFNSLNQYQRLKGYCNADTELGLRLNPEHVEVTNKLYSPCVPGSRFGILEADLKHADLSQVSGFHIHALCQNNDQSLARLMQATAAKFDAYLHDSRIKWVNFGGGHMIPREDYNPEQLISCINEFQNAYKVTIILEPGEAVVYKAGTLVARVLDLVHNNMDIAILDTSATAHMPDVLEMPYTPVVTHAAKPNIYPHIYRLGGNTCLSGDIIGEYSFQKPLSIGDEITFEDMAQYTMVKNTTFNGLALPDIYVKRLDGSQECVGQFGYDSFRSRV